MPTEPTANITGRDTDVIRKALAYAIEAIDGLPRRCQERSDRDDMVMLLEALGHAELHRNGARQHLVASLADPDEDEADFIEDGAISAPSEADFISEEEDENPCGVIR
jgi:hypothetical protein